MQILLHVLNAMHTFFPSLKNWNVGMQLTSQLSLTSWKEHQMDGVNQKLTYGLTDDPSSRHARIKQSDQQNLVLLKVHEHVGNSLQIAIPA